MRLVVGCPVKQRTWVIKAWFEHVEYACRVAEVEPVYAFVADPNDPTARQLATLTAAKGRQCWFSWCKEDLSVVDERRWNHDRFERMVDLRNQLLDLVGELDPEYFLSLDSDVLLHPQTIVSLLDAAERLRFDAVGGAIYMTASGTEFPSCGWYRGMEGLVRHSMETPGVVPVGVIMAVKLMSRAAYSVDYEFSTQGEDIGWSVACERAGLRLGWDNRQWSKHIREEEDLNRIDERCGW